MPRDAVLIPLKSFSIAKKRLRQNGATDVSALAERLARGVLRACRPRTIFVLGESEDVDTFAQSQGVGYWPTPTPGLNATVAGAYRSLGADFDRLIIVHGDLHAPEGLGTFDPDQGITIVTDHHQRGTNVLVLPTGLDFHFSYGPDSKNLHESEARRLGLPYRIVANSSWSLDIDEPDDLILGLESIRGGLEAPSNERPRTD